MVRVKKPSDRPWLDNNTKKEDMVTLGATELAVLRRFVLDVLATCETDDTGVTDDLAEGAEASAQILGIVVVGDEDWDGEDDEELRNSVDFDYEA